MSSGSPLAPFLDKIPRRKYRGGISENMERPIERKANPVGEPMKPGAVSISRRYELDWLRVITIAAVFIYHSGRFFDPTDWHVKNPVLHPSLLPIMKIFELWGMPLLFVISGAGVYYALGKRNSAVFLKDRTLRLFVPLVAGIFTHIMWQVYLERLSHGQFRGSFFAFIPRYFDGMYGFGGNFGWTGLHLWFLEMLFVFSLILLPLFLWMRRGSGRDVLDWFVERIASPGAVYLMAIPVMLLLALPNPATPWTARVFGGWSLVAFIPFFLNGFAIVSNEKLYESVLRWRGVSLTAAIILTLVMSVWFSRNGEPVFGTAAYATILSLYGLSSWTWVLAVLGFSARHLHVPRRFLFYANEAVLPFYILHQTVLLTLGYGIIRQPIPHLLKWAVIALGSFVVSLGLYEVLVRRINVLRVLFGMRPASRPTTSNSS
jgi:hypothetical protein